MDCPTPAARHARALACTAAIFAAAPAAHAQMGAPPASPPASSPLFAHYDDQVEIRWYGYQLALSDALALGLFAEGVSRFRLCLSFSDHPPPCDNSESSTLLGAGASVYFAVPPVLHGLNGHWDKGAVSVGIRSAPVLLGLATSAASKDSPAAGIMLFGGSLAAMVVDDAVLASEEVPRRAGTWSLAPALDAGHRAASVTLVGSF
jgi:hypothetical protein